MSAFGGYGRYGDRLAAATRRACEGLPQGRGPSPPPRGRPPLLGASGVDLAHTAYGLARLGPGLVPRNLVHTASPGAARTNQAEGETEVAVGAEAEMGTEAEAAWGGFPRVLHRELRRCMHKAAGGRAATEVGGWR
ncbi:hypothetical protein TSOC_006729 [Tetrabaena socialis]|uniref:Uncharacterized protein n=1 Tax=Tetrabaena socialis TaxID=47790 RepID=A0A2J8A2W4_9CHLO|nr:hypothetical protein TSOC_006729 [Tetrabaena socialis]|eukprot:PNH06854.1 hypothetical protein TSOC_006729 [Tetrabaena socialis]